MRSCDIVVVLALKRICVCMYVRQHTCRLCCVCEGVLCFYTQPRGSLVLARADSLHMVLKTLKLVVLAAQAHGMSCPGPR
jgi:hypothetical protein